MASRTMKKLKRRLALDKANPNVKFEDFPRNMAKLFNKQMFKEEMAGWPSHFTTKRVK